MTVLARALPLIAVLLLASSARSQAAEASPAAAEAPPVVAAAPTPASPAPQAQPAAPTAAASSAPALLPAAKVATGYRGRARSPARAREPTRAAPDLLGAPGEQVRTSEAIRITLILTLLALIPAMAICMTPFVRIIVVLSMIRHAFGMPETPPNPVLISLALFLTGFVMAPTLVRVNAEALQPFLSGSISVREAMDHGSGPMKSFMLRQVKDKDIQAVYEMAKQPLPTKAADVGLTQLTTAFMLNELRVSFKIGFVVLLPFLLIDLVVSSILLSLGMLMVPPSTLSLPIKVLMFVLIDGWSLVLEGVVGSFR